MTITVHAIRKLGAGTDTWTTQQSQKANPPVLLTNKQF